jgi:hypothetical protein
VRAELDPHKETDASKRNWRDEEMRGEIGNHSHSCEPAGRYYIGALRELWQPLLKENEKKKILPIRQQFLKEAHTNRPL